MVWTPFGLNTVKQFLSGGVGNVTPVQNLVGGFTHPGSPVTAPNFSQGLDYSQVQQQQQTTSNYPGLSGNIPAGITFRSPDTGGGGGSDPRVTELEKIGAQRNPSQESEYQQLLSQMQSSAQSQAEAELQAALTEFDRAKEEASVQKEQLGTQRTGALSQLETAFGKSKTQAETSKKEAETATQSAKYKALSTAQGVQRQNRNVLRALGILSSSAAGEMLNKPISEYGSQAAGLEENLITRKNYIDNWLNERMGEHQTSVKEIENQYANLIGNIDRDLRFNDRQRTDAVRQAQAALSSRMSEIQRSALQYQQAAKQYEDSILSQIANLKLYQNPQADLGGIYNALLSGTSRYTPKQVGVQESEQERQKRLGLLSGLGS